MSRGRGGHDSHRAATREAAGCFGMLILGAIMVLAGLALILPSVLAAMAGKLPLSSLVRLAVIWLVLPALGIAVLSWLTVGAPGQKDPPRRK